MDIDRTVKAVQANDFATRRDQRAGGKEPEADRTVKNVCPCNENHWLACCNKFRKMSLEQRMEFVKNKGLCLNGFTTGHFVHSCLKPNHAESQLL